MRVKSLIKRLKNLNKIYNELFWLYIYYFNDVISLPFKISDLNQIVENSVVKKNFNIQNL
mgnify:CR=1 FL=1